jgi:Ca2+-binding RTX toxin-like protein
MRRSAMVLAIVAVLAGGVPNAHANSFNCFGEAPTIVGTPGDDRLVGTDGPDVIVGLDGSDFIFGGDGPDLICGGEGDDGEFLPSTGVGGLSGGLGVDKISGGPGNDEVNGGTDLITNSDSGSGDFLYGKEGDDHLCDNACAQNSYQQIDSGDDRILGGAGNDILSSTGGDDQQLGGQGHDRLGRQLFVCDATSCEEVVTVDTGADTYLGGVGDDTITASDSTEGNDVVNGGDDIDNCMADAQDTLVKCE